MDEPKLVLAGSALLVLAALAWWQRDALTESGFPHLPGSVWGERFSFYSAWSLIWTLILVGGVLLAVGLGLIEGSTERGAG